MKDLFLQLVQIASPSGHEQAMRDHISAYFNGIKIPVYIDSANNLLANLPGNKHAKILLVAHLDTVQKAGDQIKPIFQNGIFTSDRTTILGADNKSGVTILMMLAKELAQIKNRPTISFAFTSNEESGQMSSSLLDLPSIKPSIIINIDGNKKPGTVDIGGLGQTVFELTIRGKSAHAALAPNNGVHAIKLAAVAISKLRMGKYADGSTLNIGKIEGGISTNVIPDKVVLTGEARALTNLRLQEILDDIGNVFGVKPTILSLVGVPVWETLENSHLMKICDAAAKQTRVNFTRDVLQASCDANYLSLYGVPTINVNRGGSNPHSNSESIALADMEDTKSFLVNIIKGY